MYAHGHMSRCVESHMFCSTATHRVPHSQHAAMSARVHCACVTRHDAHTRHTQHPFSMYWCLRKKRFPLTSHCQSVCDPSPLSSKMVLWRKGGMPPAKKDSLSARACLHRYLINIEDMGEGVRTQQHGVEKELFFADAGMKQTCIFACSCVATIEIQHACLIRNAIHSV